MIDFKKNIEQFLNAIVEGIKDEQSQKGLTASGDSAKSLRIEVSDESGKVFGAGYIKYQRFGRGPGGMPPIQSIERWIEEKGIGDGNVRGMAFAIAKKIADKGTDIFQGKREPLDLELVVDNAQGMLADGIKKIVKQDIITKIKK